MPSRENMKTGDKVKQLVYFNTVVEVSGVRMILAALYALWIRAEWAELELAALKRRLVATRIALVLGSALLAASVLASRALLERSTSLLTAPQQEALKPLISALLLQ